MSCLISVCTGQRARDQTGQQRSSPGRLRSTLSQPDEFPKGPNGGLRNQTQQQDINALAHAFREIDAATLLNAFLVAIREGCIILELMLTGLAGVEYFSDPGNRKIFANRIKDILRAKRRDEGRPVDDIDDVIITFSDDDIKEATELFALGKEERNVTSKY